MLQRAWKRFEVMLHQGLLPNAIVYNPLLSACSKRELPHRVCKRIKAMQPNMITYGAVLSAGERDLSAVEKGTRPNQHRA